jgi:small redox-active disulfide protein 2
MEDKKMIIKILGSGCSNCKKLEANAREAVKELGIDAVIEKVENFQDIMAYGVMKTPALVVDEQVKIMGRVATVEDIKKYL